MIIWRVVDHRISYLWQPHTSTTPQLTRIIFLFKTPYRIHTYRHYMQNRAYTYRHSSTIISLHLGCRALFARFITVQASTINLTSKRRSLHHRTKHGILHYAHLKPDCLLQKNRRRHSRVLHIPSHCKLAMSRHVTCL